ncbi:hypothetical protein SUGI_0383070 [Cryptomeria japonica]|uniref:uncharacterized protein LOC131070080 n=1 Tax=Cryptomeria japonica TaxID=3369 RepID=UPI002408AAD9|nr:uncharacterized protein LOC131070080 [Cryptomeria japonica]GLJ20966.1 hypothetical protein SUGI_0383070 [Cryptomeria japonica]
MTIRLFYPIALVFLVLSNMLSKGSCQAGVGSIVRTQMQQVLAFLNTPNGNSVSVVQVSGSSVVNTPAGNGFTVTQPFLTSQSGTFTAMLVRKQTNPGLGGLGLEYCYVDVINTAAQQSIWESPCQAVTTTSPCILLLTDDGLQINDGNNEVWNNGADNYQSLVLLESGELRMVDNNGQSAWSGNDDPLVNQNCGTALSPGSLPFIQPAFSSPLEADLPNGQSVFNQPLVGANPLIGGSAMVKNSVGYYLSLVLIGIFVFYYC